MIDVSKEADWMIEAIGLARLAQGCVEPNPMVGAVLVRDGQVVARGWHEHFGGPHAEINALHDAQQQGIDPAGLMMAVTLEPCCHHGKTPPCVDALIDAKLARVIVAMMDPDPRVSGQGIAQLREAGITVDVGLCEQAARQLNEPFIKRTSTGLPWVIVKWAQTLDGRIATRTGDSQWISNKASRQYVHQLRSRVDAIIVGVNTAIADDPALTAREVEIKRQALRIVIDPNARLPRDAKMLHDKGPRVVVAGRDGDVPFTGGDLSPVLRYLADQHDAANVLVEGGAGLIGSLFTHGLVDQVLAFVAPKLLGDDQAIPIASGMAVSRIVDAWGLTLRGVERLGDDVLLDYRTASAHAKSTKNK